MKYVSNADCNYTTSNARFKSQNYFEWFNPKNWKHSSGIVVPHAFQVPCRYDHAIFEPKLAFKVSVTQPVDIALLTINDLPIGKRLRFMGFFPDIGGMYIIFYSSKGKVIYFVEVRFLSRY